MWKVLFVLWILIAGCVAPARISGPPPEFQEGKMAYARGEYRQAEAIYNRLISKYINSPWIAEAQWMLAKSIEERGEQERALKQYQLFVHNFPQHPYRTDADSKIAQLQERLYPWRSDRRIRLASVLSFSQWPSMASLQRWLDRLERSGVDTLVVKVFQNGGAHSPSGVFFRTSHAPVLLDVLTPLAESARRHHLKVYAWMSVRQMDWRLGTGFGWADLKYDDREGSFIPDESMDLFQPAIRDYITSLYQDLAAAPIDGIVFDDDLFYKSGEGLSEEARRQFTRDFGEVFVPKMLPSDFRSVSNDAFWRWAGWKSRQAYRFLDPIRQNLQKDHPLLQFGIMLSEEAILDPLQALAESSQDLLEAKRHLFDYYVFNLELSNSPGDALRLSRILTSLDHLMGQPERVLLRVHSSRLESQSVQQTLGPVMEIHLPVLARLAAFHRELGSEPLDLLFRPRRFP